MKIKVVYENKIHKLPTTLSDYKTIRKAIKELYGESLDNDFDIYTKVHPSKFIKSIQLGYDHFCIKDEAHFKNIKMYYGGLSLKFLIKNKTQSNQLSYDELNLLNQSLAPQYLDRIQKIDNHDEIEINKKKNQLQDTINQNEYILKKQVTVDCEEQLLSQITDELQQFESDEKELKKNQDYEVLQKIIIKLVDQRLQDYGLIPIIPVFKMSIEKMNPQITVEPGKTFLWSVCLKNQGNTTWDKNEIYLKCVSGENQGEKIHLNENVPAQQQCTFGSKLRAPTNSYHEPIIFKLFQQNQAFGQEINVNLKVSNKTQKLSQEDYDKLIVFQQKTKISQEEARGFFQTQNIKNMTVDQLICKYYYIKI